LNRSFLLLLVVGLTIAAWQRNRGGPPPAPKGMPAPEARPVPRAPTNSPADRSLASAARAAHK
jgi:hypothetical protein